MAVQAPDKEERENPVRNFVAGTTGEERGVKYVRAIAPDGSEHKLRSENQSDWLARGNGHKIAGAWETKTDAVVEDDEEEDEEEDESEDTGESTQSTATPSDAENAMKELVALREKAASLGVPVNDMWGKRRLEKEIAAAEFRAKKDA